MRTPAFQADQAADRHRSFGGEDAVAYELGEVFRRFQAAFIGEIAGRT
jgi:hypothetical protein